MRYALLVLPLASLACTERYLCGPGTHIEGDWCVADTPTGPGTGDTGLADSGDTGADTAADTSDTGDTADTSDTAETGDTETPPAHLVLNEYMASNDTKAADELGEFDDWVEVYNSGGQAADLGNVSLSDDSENLSLYRFPSGTTLAPGAWTVVWCDGTPEQGIAHAGFTLQSAADHVFLIRDPDGAATVVDSVEFTEMATEVSAARIPDGSDTWVITANVTPGAANQP